MKPGKLKFTIHYWMENWGYGTLEREGFDALQVADAFVVSLKAKFGHDKPIVITKISSESA